MKKQLVVCDQDLRYLRRIQDYLIRKNLTDFQIIVFDSLQDAIEQSIKGRFEITLVSENSYDKEAITSLETNNLFILQEETNLWECPYPVLDKFQSTDHMLQEILDIYTNEIGKKVSQKKGKRAKLITFFSASQSNRQTLYAFSTGQLLSRENRKVLYINLQPYTGFHELLGLQGNQDLSDLIYYALQHSEKFCTKIDNMKYTKGGLAFLPPVRDYQDLLSMTIEEWKEWLEVMLYESGYEILLLDIAGVSYGTNEILENSDLIYYIKGKKRQEIACDEQFEQNLARKEAIQIKSSLKMIEMPYEEDIDQYDNLYLSQYGNHMKLQLKEDGLLYYGS